MFSALKDVVYPTVSDPACCIDDTMRDSPGHFRALEVSCSPAKADDGVKLGLVHARPAAKPLALDDGKRTLDFAELWLCRIRHADFTLSVLFENKLHLQVA